MAQTAHQRAWYERNRERILGERATYRAEHRTEIATYLRRYGADNRMRLTAQKGAWRRAHPESGAEAAARWRVDHRDEVRQRSSDWRRANPEQARDHVRRRRAVAGTRLAERTIFDRDGWRCRLCGGRVTSGRKFPHPLSPSMDHIVPVSRGGAHTEANVQLAHFRCNQKKGAR